MVLEKEPRVLHLDQHTAERKRVTETSLSIETYKPPPVTHFFPKDQVYCNKVNPYEPVGGIFIQTTTVCLNNLRIYISLSTMTFNDCGGSSCQQSEKS